MTDAVEPAHRARAHASESNVADAAAPRAPTTAAGWSGRLRAEDSTDEQRAEAVDALVKIGAPAVPFLIDALDDQAACPFALRAIGRLGPVAVSAAPALLERMRRGVSWNDVPVLSNMGPAVIPALAKAITDESATLRSGAANVLALLAYSAGQKKDAETAGRIAEILSGLVHDADPQIRTSAITGLSHVWDARSDTTSLLLSALSDDSVMVRGTAAAFLGRCPGDASAVIPGLVHALDDPNSWVGFDAAMALRELGDRAGAARLQLLEFAKKHPEWDSAGISNVGVETLQVALRSDDAEVRRIAANTLAKMGNGAATAGPALEASLGDPSPAVRASVIDALSAAGPSAAAVPKLRATLVAPDANVRAAAARALGRANATDDVVADLVRGLSDPVADVRRECAISLGRLAATPDVCVKALVVRLDDSDLVVRAAAATAIGAFGRAAADAVPDLRHALAHDDPWIRLGAASSLVRVDPPAPDAFAALAKLAVDADRNVRWRTVIALGSLGTKDGVPTLVDRLDDRDANVRKAAAASLGQIGALAVDAVAPLEAMTKSRDAEIAAAARGALARIAAK